MGDLLFVLLVVGGLTTFFYRKGGVSQASCSEDTKVEKAVVEKAVVEETVVEETVVEETVVEETVVEETVVEETIAENALTWRVLHRVMEKPGMLQTEIYKLFPHENRKHLQATLLQLDKEKVLRREKQGNSYRLFPIDGEGDEG